MDGWKHIDKKALKEKQKDERKKRHKTRKKGKANGQAEEETEEEGKEGLMDTWKGRLERNWRKAGRDGLEDG